MKIADYKCINCGLVREAIEIKINDHYRLPDFAICNLCGCRCTRIYSPIPSIVPQGKCGNNKNGYTSNPISIKKT